jgi:PhzF family phenazine biosynthesis protein
VSTFPLDQIDAFTDRPFAGNPAAVCILTEPQDEEWMQAVAAEMNLSETAFVVPRGDQFGLRWFTPETEVDLCGHATLATAHALWERGVVDRGTTLRFRSRGGELTASRHEHLIELDFPADPVEPCQLSPSILEAIGARPMYVGRGKFDYLIQVDGEAEVIALQPDLNVLAGVETRGFIVTGSTEGSQYDFISRYFAPGFGIPEDPVTGSAHCTLASFWSEKLGQLEFAAYQASRRGGWLHVKLDGERVKLRGQAITVTRGEIDAP